MTLTTDGRHYDAQHAYLTRDVPYWRALAVPVPLRVLEVACGTGRIAIPLARDGHAVTGIDLSRSMLEQAERKAAEAGVAVALHEADMRTFELGATFDLVLLPFNGMYLLRERADAEQCLAAIRRHLAPGGRFALDFTNPRFEKLTATTHVASYDRVRQQKTVDITYRFADGSTATDQLVLRVYFPQELLALLAYNGFDVIEQYGDYDRSPLASDSPQLLFVSVADASRARGAAR